jgi:hypothetical protein
MNALQPLVRWRDRELADPRHSDRVAATLGIMLGVAFLTCFVTGLTSHFVQHPTSWFTWDPRPAGLYRVTQGLHIATGIASVPLLFAKLWSVFPRLFRWPLFDNPLHAVERLSLLPLIGGSLFMLSTGVANIELWYPWVFFFPAGHYAVSYVVIGALMIHMTSKAGTTLTVLRRSSAARVDDRASHELLDRRRFLRVVTGVSAGLVVSTAGQTVWHLRKVSLLAPRRPDTGTQGFPVNKTAAEARVADDIADPDYTLTVERNGETLQIFTLDELAKFPARSATLPIACVEGWSANQRWTGVSIRDVLAAAGAPTDRSVSVESVQRGGRYRRSTLTSAQHQDVDSLLATHVDGNVLHVDHGFPLRLIAPNRPGVLQTKWVTKLVII